MIVDQVPVTPPSEPTTQAAPAPDMITREEAEQLANARAAGVRRELEARAARKAPEPAPAPAPAPKAAAPSVDITELQRSMQSQITFETGLARIAERNKWAPEVEAKVRTLYSVEAPAAQDVSAWLTDTARLFTGAPVVAQAPSTAPAPVNSLPNVPAAISPAAPSTAVPLERDVSIFDLSPEQVHERMRKEGAVDMANPYHPRNRAARRVIRREVEAALATRRIKLS